MINENHRIPCYKNSTNDSVVVLYVRGAQMSGVAMATKFFAMVPNSCEFCVWNLLRITLLAPGILRWLPGF